MQTDHGEAISLYMIGYCQKRGHVQGHVTPLNFLKYVISQKRCKIETYMWLQWIVQSNCTDPNNLK